MAAFAKVRFALLQALLSEAIQRLRSYRVHKRVLSAMLISVSHYSVCSARHATEVELHVIPCQVHAVKVALAFAVSAAVSLFAGNAGQRFARLALARPFDAERQSGRGGSVQR